jgi:hypothetical protein
MRDRWRARTAEVTTTSTTTTPAAAPSGPGPSISPSPRVTATTTAPAGGRPRAGGGGHPQGPGTCRHQDDITSATPLGDGGRGHDGREHQGDDPEDGDGDDVTEFSRLLRDADPCDVGGTLDRPDLLVESRGVELTLHGDGVGEEDATRRHVARQPVVGDDVDVGGEHGDDGIALMTRLAAPRGAVREQGLTVGDEPHLEADRVLARGALLVVGGFPVQPCAPLRGDRGALVRERLGYQQDQGARIDIALSEPSPRGIVDGMVPEVLPVHRERSTVVRPVSLERPVRLHREQGLVTRELRASDGGEWFVRTESLVEAGMEAEQEPLVCRRPRRTVGAVLRDPSGRVDTGRHDGDDETQHDRVHDGETQGVRRGRSNATDGGEQPGAGSDERGDGDRADDDHEDSGHGERRHEGDSRPLREAVVPGEDGQGDQEPQGEGRHDEDRVVTNRTSRRRASGSTAHVQDGVSASVDDRGVADARHDREQRRQHEGDHRDDVEGPGDHRERAAGLRGHLHAESLEIVRDESQPLFRGVAVVHAVGLRDRQRRDVRPSRDEVPSDVRVRAVLVGPGVPDGLVHDVQRANGAAVTRGQGVLHEADVVFRR